MPFRAVHMHRRRMPPTKRSAPWWPYTSWALVDARVRKSEREILGNERYRGKKKSNKQCVETNKYVRWRHVGSHNRHTTPTGTFRVKDDKCPEKSLATPLGFPLTSWAPWGEKNRTSEEHHWPAMVQRGMFGAAGNSEAAIGTVTRLRRGKTSSMSPDVFPAQLTHVTVWCDLEHRETSLRI